MRHLGWILAALAFFVLACLVVAWPALRELRDHHPTRITQAETPVGTLRGLRFQIEAARFTVLPQVPDRAVVLIRLHIEGEPKEMTQWLGCSVSITDDQGRRWLSLYNELGLEIARLLGDQARPGPNCRQLLASAGQGTADETFVLPVEALDGLRLEIWDQAGLPDALSLPLRPVMRPPP